jgi:PKD repeat protein
LNKNNIVNLYKNLYIIPNDKLDFIKISSDKTSGLIPLVVHFKSETDLSLKIIKNYCWNLGNNDFSIINNPIGVYSEKSIYCVYLKVLLQNGKYIISNVINIDARTLKEISFETPLYQEKYNVGDTFELKVKVIDSNDDIQPFNYNCNIDGNNSHIVLQQIDQTNMFKVINSGYSQTSISIGRWSWVGYFFISPTKSIQAVNDNLDWYRTQWHTGYISKGKCGVACLSMSIGFQKGYCPSIQSIRQNVVGLPFSNGAIAYRHILGALNYYDIKYEFKEINQPEDLFKAINKNNIAIILIDCERVGCGSGNLKENFYDGYYKDSGGHYIIAKGYSKDHKFLTVYDPIPSDWIKNDFRYDDNISMIGKNRFYKVDNLFTTIYKRAIIIKS